VEEMKRKIDDSRLEELVSFIKEKEKYIDKEYYKNGRKEISAKFNISNPVVNIYIRRLISKGLLTEEERTKWVYDSGMRILKIKHEKYGLDLFSQMMSDARDKGIGLNPEKLISAGKKGGLSTQNNSPHVKENLKNAIPYGHSKYYYGDADFYSKGERLVGLVLQEYGLINLESGDNTQKRFGRKKADFYINDKLVVEYHPFPKEHSGVIEETEQEYLDRRTEELKPGFDGKIVLLSDCSAYKFFEKIWDLGILDTYKGVVEKFRKVKEDLKRHDEFMKDDYSEMDKPSEEDIF
jgi:hypothetical protein